MKTTLDIIIEKLKKGVPHTKEVYSKIGNLSSYDMFTWNDHFRDQEFFTKEEHSKGEDLDVFGAFCWNSMMKDDKYTVEEINRLDTPPSEMLIHNLINVNKKPFTKKEFYQKQSITPELIRSWNKFSKETDHFSKEEYTNVKGITGKDIRLWNISFPNKEQYTKEEHKIFVKEITEVAQWNRYFDDKYSKEEFIVWYLGEEYIESFEKNFGHINKLFNEICGTDIK